MSNIYLLCTLLTLWHAPVLTYLQPHALPEEYNIIGSKIYYSFRFYYISELLPFTLSSFDSSVLKEYYT